MLYWALKKVLTPLLHLLWRVEVEGSEHVPAHGPAVLAANHQSFCDSLFLPLVVRRRVTYLAKAEYFDDPRVAWFFRAVGQIPVRRGGGPESERALATAAEILAAGHLLAVYPEGTRAADPYVHRGRTGVAHLARQCGVAVVPVGIGGTADVQPIGRRAMHPFRTVTVRFGPPIQMAPDDERPAIEDGERPATGTYGRQLAGTHDRQLAGTHERHPGADGATSSGMVPPHRHAACRAFTDDLMKAIAELSGRPYVDEYVPPRTPA